MMFRGKIVVYCDNHTEHTNTLCGQEAGFYMLDQVVYIPTTGFYSVNTRDQFTHLYGMIKNYTFLIFIIMFLCNGLQNKIF
jgi:hypothetical protein